jgi:hypothetical protein
MEWELKDFITVKHTSAIIKKTVQTDKGSIIGQTEITTKDIFQMV